MYSVLDTFGEDLTKKTYVTNPAISREQEIKRAMVVLLTPEKSALLVGKPGIGKTAIVEGIAYLIQQGLAPNALKNCRIIKINATALMGTMLVDGREVLVATMLVEELKRTTNTIVFIDEIHMLIGNKTEGPMDLANILKAGLDSTMSHQADTYDIMTTFGWYEINNVKESQIKQTYNKIKDK